MSASLHRRIATTLLPLLLLVTLLHPAPTAAAPAPQDGAPEASLRFKAYLPGITAAPATLPCPTISNASYHVIPVGSAPTDRPAALHADLNLALRGYEPTNKLLGLIDYNGDTDASAPRLSGLFGPNRIPGFNRVLRVYAWNWACGGMGCRGALIVDPEVTLAGLQTTPGERISIPERGPDIYSGGYKALVLYAEERRITLKYTREDNVISGYTVHLEDVCVDPALLALYRTLDAQGRGRLPALRNDEAIGVAGAAEIRVAIRDNGTFMDPRSRKDWWADLPYSGPLESRLGDAAGHQN